VNSAALTPLTARRGGPIQGRVRVPGDKSISHRALILGALTVGRSTVAGLLEGDDVLHTAAAMRALGAQVERGPDGVWQIDGVGVGGFASPSAPLDFGNSAPAAAWRSARSPDRRSRQPSTATLPCANGRCGACSIRWKKWACGSARWPTAGACR